MGHQNSAHSSYKEPRWTYSSTVEVESTGKIIVRAAGILALGSLLLGFFLPSTSPLTAQDVVWLSLAAIGGMLLVFLGPRGLRTTAKVSNDEVFLSATGFRTRLDLESIESVTNSYFPSGGYGYRYLGKGHRGFISGGAQVDILLKDGRQYTASVQSVDEFCSAITAAKRPR